MSETDSQNVVQKLRDDLSRLLEFVERTRSGFENIENTVIVGSEKVPEASVQIKAVTGDLETAANTIMTILEDTLSEHDRGQTLLASLSEWIGALPVQEKERGAAIISELGSIHENAKKNLMDIFTNMSFHDLSGQKLKKVNTSLSVVEAKLLDMAMSFGMKNIKEEGGACKSGAGKTVAPMDQNIVDQLLRELGT